jgi:hypothetical protein
MVLMSTEDIVWLDEATMFIGMVTICSCVPEFSGQSQTNKPLVWVLQHGEEPMEMQDRVGTRVCKH